MSQPRPVLHEVSVESALKPPQVTITMSVGQWDHLLATAYGLGATLLELDDDEQPIRAYRKPPPETP